MEGARSGDSIPETVSDEHLRDYQAKLTDLRRQMAELSTSLTPLHPKVKRVQAQIAEVESAISKARNNVLARIRSEYESAKRREQLIGAAYTGQATLGVGWSSGSGASSGGCQTTAWHCSQMPIGERLP